MSSASLEGIDIYKTPVIPNPNGDPPNFNAGLSSIQIVTIVVFTVTFFFATLSLALRWFTIVRITRAFELDALLILAAWFTALGYFIVCVVSFDFGFGQHAWNVSIAQAQEYLKWLIPITLLYTWGPNLTKLAILSVLHRVSSDKVYRLCIYLLALSICGYCTTFTIITSWRCNPTRVGVEGCIARAAMAQVAVNVWADVMIIILPLPTLYKLQMPRRQKLVVAGLLTLGSAILIISIVRAPYIQILGHTKDYSAKQAEAGVWSIVELNLSILCSNLMRMKPFLKEYLPSIMNKLGLSSSGRNKDSNRDRRTPMNVSGQAGHSYQLHSMGPDKIGRAREGKGVVVTDEYSVHVERMRKDRDGSSSMDSILGPDPHRGVAI